MERSRAVIKSGNSGGRKKLKGERERKIKGLAAPEPEQAAPA